jgi:hypothetical protein
MPFAQPGEDGPTMRPGRIVPVYDVGGDMMGVIRMALNSEDCLPASRGVVHS